MINLHDGKNLEITNMPEKYAAAIKKRMTLVNPAYTKAVRKKDTKRMYGTRKDFKYYKEAAEALVLPKAMAASVTTFLAKHDLRHGYRREKVVIKRTESLISKIVLRDYQLPLEAAMVQHGLGIVELSGGGGKTLLALNHAANSGLTATIIVEDKTKLYQFRDECKEYLSYDPGIIGGGKKEIKDITIATIQTLKADRELLGRLAAHTSVLIVDECQSFVSDLSVEVLGEFAPDQMFGLTGTPYRSDDDGRTDAIQFIFGKIIVTHRIETIKPVVEVYATGADIPVLEKDGKIEYAKMVDLMINHESRNRLISGMAMGEMMSGRKLLILTKRVAHAETLKKLIPAAHLMQRDTKGKTELLRGMKTGEVPFSCIIGTSQLLGTGFDVPLLDTLFIAGDAKSNVLTVQMGWRITRMLEGKTPRIIDFMDEQNGIFKNQFRYRKQVYKKLGWKYDYHYLDKGHKIIKELKKYD